jgi:hypothetical protein
VISKRLLVLLCVCFTDSSYFILPRVASMLFHSYINMRDTQTNSSGGSRRRTFKHQVHQWTGREVTMWLKALDLSSYIETFARNEITGSVLLELGQSDLDYMNIKALGHRKIIMREIERLKRGKSSVDLRQGGTIDASPPRGNSSNNGSPNGRGRKQKRLLTVNNSESNLKVQGTSTNTSPTNQRFRFAAEETSPQQIQRREQRMREQQQTSSSPKTKKHWSHVKPISENEITGDGTVPVNLADGNYDESKQQSLFQQAVMEWRNPKQTATSSSSSSAGGLAAGGSMWNNPFEPSQKPNSLSNGTLDVEAEQKKFQQAVMEWRNGGKSSPTTHTPPATRNSSSSTGYEGKTSEHTIHAVVTKPRHTKFDGTLDEAGEHEKFRDAVTAWRNGNCKKSPVSSASVANELMLKMAEEDRKRREKFQLEKEELEREMRRERDALAKRREDAASKLAASKYSEDAVGGKHQEDRNDGSATARRRKYEKWSDVAGIEIEY